MKQHRDSGSRTRGADALLARLDGMVRTVNGQLGESFREELGGELTLPQYRLLRMIAKARADRVRDVAIFLGATTPAASKAVERLARRGLVDRVGAPDDRRVWRLRLTSAGKQLLARHETVHRRVLGRVFGRCKTGTLERALDLLDKLSSDMEVDTGTDPH
jgi:DNA-binding MarR family transcriptional regulator